MSTARRFAQLLTLMIVTTTMALSPMGTPPAFARVVPTALDFVRIPHRQRLEFLLGY